MIQQASSVVKDLPQALSPTQDASLPQALTEAVRSSFQDPKVQEDALSALRAIATPDPPSRLDILNNYMWVFVIAFAVTLVATPIMRMLAVKNGVIDRPSEARKIHRQPIAYLGGAACFVGMMAGIFYSYLAILEPSLMSFHPSKFYEADQMHLPVPPAILIGMTVIMLTGLIDDVVGLDPRLKISGQLFAAAALAIDQVGANVARGVLAPIGKLFGNEALTWQVPLPIGSGALEVDLIYWAGTIIIGLFVLGACNASNLIDGLDGLLTGVTGIASAGLLIIALGLAAIDDGPRDGQRIILCLALLGACLGFLPHNFNPATIFQGDCGSLLLGFTTISIVLMLGDTGKTQLVTAGLIIYAIPLIDTSLAIVRRKMAGKKLSDADADHLHHMLKRSLGVKGAALTLYAIGTGFATLGVALSLGRARVVYVLAFMFAAFIGVTAIKIARKKQIEEAAAAYDKPAISAPAADATPPAKSA